MRFKAARRIACACTVMAAGAFAVALPATASAAVVPCHGEEITGQGSSLQAKAQQELWDGGFNTSTAKHACSKAPNTPKVNYTSSSSGAGLKSWGIESAEEHFSSTNAFVGTDEPPNEEQIKEFLKHEKSETVESLLTIPVAEEAVAVIVNLPTGCKASSEPATGRLVLKNATLTGIYDGTITTWGQINESGDKLEPESCNADTITPIGRSDQSGTTHIFKRYLNLIEPKALETSSGEKTFAQLSEGALNLVWPTKADVKAAKNHKGLGVEEEVEAVPGSIGYVNVAEARVRPAFGGPSPSGGPGTQSFWVELENATKGKGAKIKYTYTDPAEGGDVSTPSTSNCKKTSFTNGSKPVPPPSVKALWNELTTSAPEARRPSRRRRTHCAG